MTVPGLVLAEDMVPSPHGTAFESFATGFVWIPYPGERRSSLTT
jgi:hypothetical protein